MNFLHLILTTLLELFKAITYKWILAIVAIIQRLLRFIQLFLRQQKLPHDEKNATNDSCGPLDHPSFHRADPLIYSQKYLQSLGLAVTWDNPDIILRKNGVVVTETKLLPNTEYEIEATVWNNSYEAPVVGMPVNFSFLSFGVGTTITPIASDIVNIGVKGSPSHPARARVKWITPPQGHYCIQVDFAWADDINPNNNIGQNNVDVKSPQSPAVFYFDLQNPFKKRDHFHFEVDTYSLPGRPVCQVAIDKTISVDEKWEQVKTKHSKEKFPVPGGWSIEIIPDNLFLQPGEVKNIQVQIEPPSDFTGEKSFNINALNRSSRFVGGATLTVVKS